MREETYGRKGVCRFLTILILLFEVCFSFTKAESSFGALITEAADGYRDECRLETASYGGREVCAPVRLEGRQQAEHINFLRKNTTRRFSWNQTANLTENSMPEFPEPVLEAVCTETEGTVYGHTAIVQFIHSMDGKKS